MKRIVWSIKGVDATVTTSDLNRMMTAAFEMDGFDYFVHRVGYRVWKVYKCRPCKPPEVEYRLDEGKVLSCDCPSGKRNLQCRHKEMVASIIIPPKKSVLDKKELESFKRQGQELLMMLEKAMKRTKNAS